ncbi:phage portal protein [Enterococcus thailandicus]|uniref:phage portal protein n=1 Tax=Enterococcus thailandicus TaxID=417368 RepID=UPI0025438EBE|nr:phage portal protein [Enterococcus thailandicus]MDK4351673.1 phage portal protein [Enterococcus thailandicus]MDT2735436.1 phage portal protein [Enterococcus thailandicus]
MQQDITFLRNHRYHKNANAVFRMAEEDFESIDFESEKWIHRLEKYINRHRSEQLPRLQELKRYYLADNNIKYRPSKTDEYAADNRIASDFARYITIFEQGYMLGQPVQYKNENDELQIQIDDFNKRNNEAYHNVLVKTDLSIYGRAYELETVVLDAENNAFVKLVRLDPEKTFVVYDDTTDSSSLFGVYYYTIDYGDGQRKYFVNVYTSDMLYMYVNDNQNQLGLRLVDFDDYVFNGVPVNEFANNEDRTGAYEPVLDSIDAYDLSQSELANFQQDSMDAILMITGNPYTGTAQNDLDEEGNIVPNSRLAVSLAFKRARIMIMDDNPNPNGSTPDAKYLIKEYDAAGSETYKQRLVNDILRFTFTPDTLDNSFSGTQSGEAMKYKLMASDNRRVMQQRLFEKGLMRRLRLAVNVWRIKGNDSVAYDQINDTNIIFTANVPKSDSEVVALASQLVGQVSDETLFEILSTVTGVDPDVELDRIKEDTGSEPRRPEMDVKDDGQEEQ